MVRLGFFENLVFLRLLWVDKDEIGASRASTMGFLHILLEISFVTISGIVTFMSQ